MRPVQAAILAGWQQVGQPRAHLQTPGLVVGMFLVGYGLARSFCEFFRSPDPAHALTVGGLTPGIAYSIPMILLGLAFLRRARSPSQHAA